MIPSELFLYILNQVFSEIDIAIKVSLKPYPSNFDDSRFKKEYERIKEKWLAKYR